MATSSDTQVSLNDVLGDVLLTKYMPRGFDNAIIKHQLRDPKLDALELDELLDLSAEELLSQTLAQGLAAENEYLAMQARKNPGKPKAEEKAEAPEDDPACDPDDPMADLMTRGIITALGPKVQILVEDLAVEAKILMRELTADETPPNEQEIRKALAEAGVVRGIRFEYLSRLAERPIYGRKFKIALGRMPEDGEDAVETFHFQTTFDLTPQIKADGTADYKALDYAKSVKAGELLCEITPPTPGKSGFSVFGEVLPARSGQASLIRNGGNTSVSEDGSCIYATCDGQVQFKNNKISVSRVLMVDHVNSKTGNILFVGTVQVNGDVDGGFTIRAGGDIVIKGISDDAVLVAGGNVVLCGGMKGRNSGVIDAGRDIRTFFIENAKVRARNNIYADALLNATIECGQIVNLSGRRGCLIGGRCTAGNSISAIQIGNEANVATRITLKDIESFAEHQAKTQVRIDQRQKTLKKLVQTVTAIAENGQDDTNFQVLLVRMVIIKRKLEQSIKTLQSTVSEGRNMDYVRRVIIRETLYPNVLLEIDEASYRSKVPRINCVAVKSKGKLELRSGSLY